MKKLLLFVFFFNSVVQPVMYAMHKGEKVDVSAHGMEGRTRKKVVARERGVKVDVPQATFSLERGGDSFDRGHVEYVESEDALRYVDKSAAQDACPAVRVEAFGEDCEQGRRDRDYESDGETLEVEDIETLDPVKSEKRLLCTPAKAIMMLIISLLTASTLGLGTALGISEVMRAGDYEKGYEAGVSEATTLACEKSSMPLLAGYYWECLDSEGIADDIGSAKACLAKSDFLVERHEVERDFLCEEDPNLNDEDSLLESLTKDAPPVDLSVEVEALDSDGIITDLDLLSEHEDTVFVTGKSIIKKSKDTMLVTPLADDKEQVLVSRKSPELITMTLLPSPPGTPPVEDYSLKVVEFIE